MVDPAGPAARSIATLWWVMFIGACAILALVTTLLIAAFRTRQAEADASREARREKIWIIGLGLGFSMSILAALLAYGLIAGERLIARAGPDTGVDIVRVAAEARQWEWRFAYDDRPGHVTENLLHIPAGRPVDVAISSADVVHSFWVPRLAGKLDAIPGHVNLLRIEADAPGTYRGLTAEYNGQGYRRHVFAVQAHDPESWAAFLAGDTP
ncbi:cytochrome c oxidase subunit II [Roseovarius sp. C7]|uniref:cytochrome c oxidase subunit II n=1 Tax=Roseovarius sp. C7 TaxID=3398643 RepID=UPI0039F6E16B